MAQKFCYGCMKAKEQSPICEHCGFDERHLNLNHQLPIGTILNNQYILGRVLGQGGFGITYIGWDRVLDMPVAIKEYFPNGIVYRNIGMGPAVQSYSGDDDTVFQKHKGRFMREARSLAQLASIPEIVQVKNFFEENNTAYIVMEYVDGVTLKNYIKWIGRPLSMQETMQIMDPVLKGMAAVHERNLIHRDISPDNIMLQSGGGVKIIDFGTVRYMNDVQRSKSTESVLKPGFAPMEQYNTKGNVGTWTDVYALCATFHYCLSGQLPPDAPSRLEVGEKLTTLEAISDLPKHVIRTLETGMKIRISDRTQTVSALFEQLHDPSKAPKTDDKPAQISQSKKSSKWLVLTAIGAAAILIICVMLFSLEDFAEKKEPVIESTPVTEAAAIMPTIPSWKSNMLMSCVISDKVDDPTTSANEAKINNWPVFGSTISRSKIIAATFLDSTATAPVSAWDVSADGSGKVLAWVENEGNMYHLFIAADGGVNGEKSSEELFYHYQNLERVEFNGCYHTDYATSFAGMFDNCISLQELDLSDWNTENVLDMSTMFQGCVALTQLDISGFDTSRVISMLAMFNGTESWKDMNISHFNTGRVKKYRSFYHEDYLPDGTYWLSLFE